MEHRRNLIKAVYNKPTVNISQWRKIESFSSKIRNETGYPLLRFTFESWLCVGFATSVQREALRLWRGEIAASSACSSVGAALQGAHLHQVVDASPYSPSQPPRGPQRSQSNSSAPKVPGPSSADPFSELPNLSALPALPRPTGDSCVLPLLAVYEFRVPASVSCGCWNKWSQT